MMLLLLRQGRWKEGDMSTHRRTSIPSLRMTSDTEEGFCFQLLTFWTKGLLVSAPCFCWETCSNFSFAFVCVCVCAHPVYFPVTEGPFVVTNESRRDHYRAWTALCPGNCVLISCQTVAQKPEPLTAVSVSLGASGQGSTMSVKRREATAGWTGRVYGAGRWMKLSKSTVVVLSQ